MDSASTHAYDEVRRPAARAPRALATEAVHAGRDDLARQGLHAPPIDLSTTYPSYDSRAEAARIDAFAATGADPDGPPVYGRLGNPTVARFETALARLEGTESAVAFASGMAALSAVLLVRASMGLRHVVAVRPLYGCSDHLLTAGLLGSEVTWTDPAGITDALRPDTGLVMVESPANPTLAEVDLRAVAHACGSVPLLADNTFATPVLQRPAESGARLVLHSATNTLAATATCWPAWSPATRSSPDGCGRYVSPRAASSTRSPATCCCAACRPCRSGSAPPRRARRYSPAASPPTRASPASTTRGSAAR
jgi:methionine-gamma-lyase